MPYVPPYGIGDFSMSLCAGSVSNAIAAIVASELTTPKNKNESMAIDCE